MEKKNGLIKLESHEPCGHPGCERHISHPCEKCGRIGAEGEVVLKEEIERINYE